MAKKKETTKDQRIAAAVGACAAVLEAEGVKYFIAIVDRDPKDPHGGKAYSQMDCTGADMELALDILLVTPQDLINFGTYLGRIIQTRKKAKI